MKTLKKVLVATLLSLTFLSAFVFSACNKAGSNQIVGSWKSSIAQQTDVGYVESIIYLHLQKSGDASMEIIIKVDGEDWNDGGKVGVGTYDYDAGNKELTLTIEGDTQVFDVLTLNSSTLVIESGGETLSFKKD